MSLQYIQNTEENYGGGWVGVNMTNNGNKQNSIIPNS